MVSQFKQYWPLALGAAMFVGMSLFSDAYDDELAALFTGDSSAMGVALFLMLGIGISLIPTMSTLALIPLAASLWGWPIAALLIVVVWTVAGQILFEFARFVGKSRVEWFFTPELTKIVEGLIGNHGFFKSLALRFVLDGEIVSYAFGMFSSVSRIQFFALSLMSSLPSALAYAYLGNLPLWLQLGAVAFAIIPLVGLKYLKKGEIDRVWKGFLARFEPVDALQVAN